MNECNKKTFILGCSFGKDSLATFLLAMLKNEPLDRIVFAEVMYDNKRNISAEHPKQIEWIYEKAIPKIKEFGYDVDVVRAEIDFRELFYRKHVYGKFEGYIYGYPLEWHCAVNRDMKLKPLRSYYKQFSNIVEYIGIATNEEKRLASIDMVKRISLLVKYNLDEKDAFELCRRFDLLSPLYESQDRGGCWICPNRKMSEFAEFKSLYPELWDEYVNMGNGCKLCTDKFRYGKTLFEIDSVI